MTPERLLDWYEDRFRTIDGSLQEHVDARRFTTANRFVLELLSEYIRENARMGSCEADRVSDQAVRLGLVDFTWINSGQSPAEALQDTLALGEHAEKLGFSRCRLGEHHVQGHACGSPQILAAILAMRTSRIRIGVAAMLLHYWAPLKLVEDFLLLEELFRRIDLGVARDAPDNLRSHRALLDGRPSDDDMLRDDQFGVKRDDLVGHMRGFIEPAHPHYGAAVIPNVAVMPEVWVCGRPCCRTRRAHRGPLLLHSLPWICRTTDSHHAI